MIFVEVTEKYREIQEESKNYALSRFSQSINSLSEEELHQVLTGLNLMQKALERSKHTTE